MEQEEIQLDNLWELPVATPHPSLPIMYLLVIRKLGNPQGFFPHIIKSKLHSWHLYLQLACSAVAYWTPTDLGGGVVQLSVSCLSAFSYCSWGSRDKNAEVVFHSLLQWTTLLSELSTITRSSWVAHAAWLIISLSYAKLWSTCSFCLE